MYGIAVVLQGPGEEVSLEPLAATQCTRPWPGSPTPYEQLLEIVAGHTKCHWRQRPCFRNPAIALLASSGPGCGVDGRARAIRAILRQINIPGNFQGYEGNS
jgi:hypothetical protein